MKRFIFLLAFVVLMATPSLAQDAPVKHDHVPPEICTQQPDNVETLLFAKRGCCSHHGGVAGCKNGRVVCADGSLSPSCKCLKSNGDADIPS